MGRARPLELRESSGILGSSRERTVLLRFGDCVLDLEARELLRGGARVPLAPKALQFLSLLLESRPRALDQAALRDALWPDSSVGYTSLAGVVAELRKAVGDTRRPWRYVRTVPRFGYAFGGEVVSEVRPKGREVVAAFVTEGREYPVAEGETLIGRGGECGVRLLSSQVSRVHARVRATGSAASVEDLGSKNGTWVNGERREGAVELADGDEVTFGTFRVLYRRDDGAAPTRTGSPR